jgi:hypothetical protein
MLTLSGYTASGGVRGAIAETAESVFVDQFTPEQQELARRVFLRLTELGDDISTGDSRRRIAFDEVVSDAGRTEITRTLVQRLADARLITTAQDSIEVAHEALIREWPRLRGWLDENRQGLRLQRRISEPRASGPGKTGRRSALSRRPVGGGRGVRRSNEASSTTWNANSCPHQLKAVNARRLAARASASRRWRPRRTWPPRRRAMQQRWANARCISAARWCLRWP